MVKMKFHLSDINPLVIPFLLDSCNILSKFNELTQQ